MAAGVAVMALSFISFRPAPVEAAAPVVIASGTLKSFTKDEAGKVTAVVVTIPAPGCTGTGIGATAVAPVDCTYTVGKSSIFRDANNRPLKTAYFIVGDTISLRVTKLAAGGELVKLVDKQVMAATLEGKVSAMSDPNMTFTFTIARRIKEIVENATFATSVVGTTATTVKQIEISKSGTRNVRTLKTKAWTDIDDGQTVTVTGFWHARLRKIDATHVQLPNKTL